MTNKKYREELEELIGIITADGSKATMVYNQILSLTKKLVEECVPEKIKNLDKLIPKRETRQPFLNGHELAREQMKSNLEEKL